MNAVSPTLAPPPSTLRHAGYVLRENPLTAVAAAGASLLCLVALFSPLLTPYDPVASDVSVALQPPSAAHWAGTDQLGRDVLSRVIWGARLSLYVGLASVLVGITLGSLWGAFTGYFGGATDTTSQRVVDCVMALPPIILALSLMAAVGQSVDNVILALTILLTPTAARTVRSVALGIAASPFIEAARASGGSQLRIVVRHVLPNCLATYIVLVTTNISYAIVVEASLSFLGVGAPPDEPSWGGMLTAGTQAMGSAPWLIFFPGLAISLAVFALNLLGDAIRDIADPRLRGGLG